MSLTEDEERELLAKVREIHAAMLARRAASAGANTAPARAAPVAAPAGAKHDPNDPTVKILPKGWKGEDLRGRRYSECPPQFLGMLSHMLDAFAAKNDEDPERQRYAKWDRENAEAARKWRAKLEGKTDDLFEKPKEAPATDKWLDDTF